MLWSHQMGATTSLFNMAITIWKLICKKIDEKKDLIISCMTRNFATNVCSNCINCSCAHLRILVMFRKFYNVFDIIPRLAVQKTGLKIVPHSPCEQSSKTVFQAYFLGKCRNFLVSIQNRILFCDFEKFYFYVFSTILFNFVDFQENLISSEGTLKKLTAQKYIKVLENPRKLSEIQENFTISHEITLKKFFQTLAMRMSSHLRNKGSPVLGGKSSCSRRTGAVQSSFL